MDKITTLNTLKNVFSALGAKTTDDNYAVGLFDKTSAEPKGIMGMSDFASVLGGVPVDYSLVTIGSGSSSALDECKTYWNSMENDRIAFAKVLATANAFGFVAKCKSGNLTAGIIKIIEFSTGTVHCYKKRYDSNSWESATF